MKLMNIYLLFALCTATTGAMFGAAMKHDAQKGPAIWTPPHCATFVELAKEYKQLKQDKEALLAQKKENENECAMLIAQIASNAAKSIYKDHPELPEQLRQAMAKELEAMYLKSTSPAEIRAKTCSKETNNIVASYKKKAEVAWQLMAKCLETASESNTERLKKLVTQYGLAKSPEGQTILIEAAIAGNKPIMQWLLDEGKVDVNEKGAQGTTALLEVAKTYESMFKNNALSAEDRECWRKNVLLWLIDKGADNKIQDNTGTSANAVLESVLPHIAIMVPSAVAASSTATTAAPSEPKLEQTKEQHVIPITAKLTNTSPAEAKRIMKQYKLHTKFNERRREKESQDTITGVALAKREQEQQAALRKKQIKAANILAHEVALAKKVAKEQKNHQLWKREQERYQKRNGQVSTHNNNAVLE